MWWFMLCCDMLIPALMIIGGRIMWKHPPKEINDLIGYRTSRSMKNIDTWIFAHKYSGKLWWSIGWLITPITIVAHVPFYASSDHSVEILSLILIAIQTILLIFTIFLTERALKKRFTEEGIQRKF